jgi:transposase-like protein
MFQPPRCPHRRCPRFAQPTPGFCAPHGSYKPRCRPRSVPRFRCKSCGRTFSRQTFRMDYRDHRPDLNVRLFRLLASGVGLRQSARNLHLSRHCTELKARKIGRHLRRLNLNLRGPLPSNARLQFDELETYEGRRNTRPLSVPLLIEATSYFVIWGESAPIRPSGRMSDKRLAAIASDERILGPRRDLSRSSALRTLKRGSAMASDIEVVRIDTDEKSTYPGLLREAFGKGRFEHTRTNSKLARGTWNRLFPINHTEALARDLTGRLRRESWLASKRRRWLDIALHVLSAYRNYVRRRTNESEMSPAQMLGFVPRRLTEHELLSWRQDGGLRSIHPLARRAQSVEEFARSRGLRA